MEKLQQANKRLTLAAAAAEMHSFKLSFDLISDSLCGLQVVLLSRRLAGVRGGGGEGAGQLLCSPPVGLKLHKQKPRAVSDG